MDTIVAKGLCKSFGGKRAVDNVSLAIAPGTVFGLLGRNGAGKTTTIRMMMSIYPCDKGEVTFQGHEAGLSFRDSVGYLPEERGLYGKMQVLETILFFAEIKGMPLERARSRAMDYLARFGLTDRIADKVETLSKGNQQKIQFIIAVIHDPVLVILDEPFSGLDPVNTSLLIEMMQDLKDHGKAIIFSTHIMDFAERLCDRIALLDEGRVVLEGPLADIKEEYGQCQVSLMADSDLSFVSDLPYVASAEAQPQSMAVTVDTDDDIQRLLGELVRRDIVVRKFDATDVTLHDIFVDVTGHQDEAGAEQLT